MNILLQYAQDILTPTKEQVSFLKSKIRKIKAVLTQNASLKPAEIKVGGSFEKGTMLRHKIDADIVCIYNANKEVGSNWQKLVTSVYTDLAANFPNMESEPAGKLAIHLCTELEGLNVNLDVVPCYFVNSPAVMKDHTNSNLYQAITTTWHCRYLQRYKDEEKYPFFQNIVRLLKDWKREQDVPFIKSIHLELITADAYDCNDEDFANIGDNDIPFILDRCFEDIVDTLDGYPVLPYRWKYCNDEDFAECYNAPVLIDPANPADNLLSGIDKTDIRKIRRKVNITREKLNNGYYEDVFNRKGQTDFFRSKN
jgi:hypothetical protein